MSDATRLILDLFATVPHVMVSVKDDHGRYAGVNEAFVRQVRRSCADEVIGHCADELFAPELAASYDAQDRALRATGHAVRNQLEIIAEAATSNVGRWFLTTKILATTEAGAMVVATSVDARLGDRAETATGLRAAVELAHARCCEPLRVADLAEAADMSTDRLERAMRRVLAISPKQYLVRLRAEYAAAMLATTDRPIAEIAAECGYFDQSQMTRQFRDHIGLTPHRYRIGTDPSVASRRLSSSLAVADDTDGRSPARRSRTTLDRAAHRRFST